LESDPKGLRKVHKILFNLFAWPQSRADYSHDNFCVEVNGTKSSVFRRSFDWLVVPKVTVKVTMRDWQPCMDCFTGVMTDLRNILGTKRLVVDYPAGVIEAKVPNPDRQVPLLDDVFEEFVQTVSDHLRRFHQDHRSATPEAI